jgi:beta-phosphoglucomutase
MAVRGFLFDLDGVLTDTAEYHFQAWKRLADEVGIPFEREDNEALRGIPRRESLLLILKGRAFPEEQMQEFMQRKNSYYLELIRGIAPADLLPGARTLLEEIQVAGLKSSLASSSKNAVDVVERLGIRALLNAISDGNSVTHQKPAPDLFLHAASQLGLAAAECVVVEDAAAGVEAALAGGFFAVGLGPRERVGAAHLVLPSLEGVHLGHLLSAMQAQ